MRDVSLGGTRITQGLQGWRRGRAVQAATADTSLDDSARAHSPRVGPQAPPQRSRALDQKQDSPRGASSLRFPEGSPMKMTDAQPDIPLEAHPGPHRRRPAAPNFCCIKSVFTVWGAGCSDEEPQAQPSSCVLWGLEIALLAQTEFFLLKGIFSMLSSPVKAD